jgi:M6 family metalloprotease-like protein
MWGVSGTTIGRIGVIAHETGHFLGLPDLYDTDGPGFGSGLGSFSLMANSWGFDGTQRTPPLMDAWSKIKLGWMQPTPITASGVYTINAAASTPQVFMITQVRCNHLVHCLVARLRYLPRCPFTLPSINVLYTTLSL